MPPLLEMATVMLVSAPTTRLLVMYQTRSVVLLHTNGNKCSFEQGTLYLPQDFRQLESLQVTLCYSGHYSEASGVVVL